MVSLPNAKEGVSPLVASTAKEKEKEKKRHFMSSFQVVFFPSFLPTLSCRYRLGFPVIEALLSLLLFLLVPSRDRLDG